MRQEELKKLTKHFKDDRCSGGGLNQLTKSPVKAKRHFSCFVWAQNFSFLIANEQWEAGESLVIMFCIPCPILGK